ncbi:hypothetical protein PS682_04507 [Pseudomonas fluorescens]|nr:hypothetical protein PS682_04507 [Pseudomonas fluorescens]
MTTPPPQATPAPESPDNKCCSNSDNKGANVWMTAIVAAITAAGTLGGTFISSYVEGVRSDRKLEREMQSECVKRVDDEEKQFRSLAEGFNVSIGRFGISLMNSDSNEKMLPTLLELSDTGRRLGTHYSPEFNSTTTALIDEIVTQILHPSGEHPSIDAKQEKWQAEYSSSLKSFDNRRNACSSNTSLKKG